MKRITAGGINEDSDVTSNKKPKLIDENTPILNIKPKGLHYEPDFITSEEAKKVVDWIDNQHWSDKLQRKTQQYGYEYGYTSKFKTPEYLGSLPEIFDFILKRIEERGLVRSKLDQVIVNGN